jgi:hypothetical protein
LSNAQERPQLRKNEWHWERPGHIPCLTSGAANRHRGDGGRDRGIAFLKHLKTNRRTKMTGKLFDGLRVVFGSQPDRSKHVEQWYRIEYGDQWQQEYNEILYKNPLVAGVDYNV